MNIMKSCAAKAEKAGTVRKWISVVVTVNAVAQGEAVVDAFTAND